MGNKLICIHVECTPLYVKQQLQYIIIVTVFILLMEPRTRSLYHLRKCNLEYAFHDVEVQYDG